MEKIAAGFTAYPGHDSELNCKLLVESIRSFGGSLSDMDLFCLIPDAGTEPSKTFMKFLDAKRIHVHRFSANRKAFDFPLALEAYSAKSAEEIVSGKFKLLVWLGSNTIVLNEPKRFLIPKDKTAGLRPVHHTNIGSPVEKPLNSFWTEIYRVCSVHRDKIFPMETHIDGKIIRPYFNATFLVERPECGLLSKWFESFERHYQSPKFLELYEKDGRLPVFMHQAILTGVILASIASEDFVILPGSYNYPLHLWEEDVTKSRPKSLNEITAARHEGFYRDKNWKEKMPEGDSVKNWLSERLEGYSK